MKVFAPIKGRAPVPMTLPGRFFVLEWDREDKSFTLRTDDPPDMSTYDLGDEIEQIQMLFRLRETQHGKLDPRKVDDLIDYAKGFGLAQYIPQAGVRTEDRVLPILPREAPQQELDFEPKGRGWNARLR